MYGLLFEMIAICKKPVFVGVLLFISTILAAEDTGYYPFEIPGPDDFPYMLGMSDKILDPPAGKHGYVVINNGKLFFEDGAPVKLWGVGITLSSGKVKFPAKKGESKAIVKRLAKYGVNHVRIVGLDYTLPVVYSSWKRGTTEAADILDRFDYFIGELVKAGIYYSLSINNSSFLVLNGNSDVQTIDSRKESRRYMHVRLYDDKAISLVEDWIDYIYSRKNPYTGYTYAQDPANIYTVAVNEDSIFWAYRDDFKYLTNSNIDLLTKKFNVYLEDKLTDTAKLSRNWLEDGKTGLDADESLGKGNVRIVVPKEFRRYSKARIRTTLRFLADINYKYGIRIKQVLDKLGYKGLFSISQGTDLGSLYSNGKLGNYSDLHGYFDHPKSVGRLKKYEEFENTSFIEGFNEILNEPLSHNNDRFYKGLERTPIYRTYCAAITDKPLIISEWNQVAWGDYSYEGALLLSAYASIQGVPVLDAFTFFNHPHPDPKEEVARNPFALIGNPVFLALSPSLSLAFTQGYIQEAQQQELVTYARTEDEYLDLVADRLRRRKTLCVSDVPDDKLFSVKTRHQLFGPVKQLVSDSGKESMDAGKQQALFTTLVNKGSSFIVDTEKFKIVAGRTNGETIVLNDIDVSLNNSGAVTVISLDDLPISESSSILVTAVHRFKNTGSLQVTEGDGSVIVKDTGRPPILMGKVHGNINLRTLNKGGINITSYGSDHKAVNNPKVITEGKIRTISVDLAAQNSPWYLISIE